jgi:hypothetical protein
MWNEFLAPSAIPSVQVNAREKVAPARPMTTEEEYGQDEWLRDFINQTEDASRSGANGHDRSLDEWLASTFGEAVLLGQDEEDETVPNVLNAACSFIHQLEPTVLKHFSPSIMSRFNDAIRRVRKRRIWKTVPR